MVMFHNYKPTRNIQPQSTNKTNSKCALSNQVGHCGIYDFTT